MEPPARADPGSVDPHEVVAGRYRLDRSIGTSGMAEVFIATDLQLRRSIAVKRLPSTAMEDATAQARFAREARALARVNDPNVVTVFDIVVDDGRPFMIMELVEGTTLRDLVDAERRLEPARVISIASGICSGLAAVHANGIVHRDMKPSNVFLTTSGAVKIGDFGIASVASDVKVTRAGEVFGSAPYVSPEQVTGDQVDPRADLYSLGCVMFEMATGRPPFAGDDPAALAYQHVHTKPERADALVQGFPPALASMIDRLMAKDPEDRPESADAVLRSLEAMPLPSASDVGDVSTQRLTPVAATDLLPEAAPLRRPPLPPRQPPRSSSSLLWSAGLVAGIILLLVVHSIYGGAGSAVRAKTPAKPRSSSPAMSPTPGPSPPSPIPSSPSVGSVESATTALIGLVQELISSRAVDEHLARDLQHGVEDISRALNGGEATKIMDSLGRLQDKTDNGLERAEISSQDAQRLDEAINALASAIDASAGSGDEGSD
jgi:eukaryotic-like serine/threonine-protein kinase